MALPTKDDKKVAGRESSQVVDLLEKKATETVAEVIERQNPGMPEGDITMFAGPLPPPEILASYEKLCPGSMKTIIQMAVDESKHRRKMESIVVTSKMFVSRLGVITGIGLPLVALLAAFVCIAANQAVVGAGIIGALSLPHIINSLNSGNKQEEKKAGK